VIDLDVTRSPILAKNFLKLCKSRYYTQTLVYNVQALRFCQLGDPRGDGTGGCSIYGLIDAMEQDAVEKSKNRFLQLSASERHIMELTKEETRNKGIVAVIPEMAG